MLKLRSMPCDVTFCPGSSSSRSPSEGDLDLVGLEGDQVADRRHLVHRRAIRPRGVTDAVDVVVGGDALVGAERLQLHRRQRLGDDVGPGHVPAGSEARLVQHRRIIRVGDDPVAGAHHETAGGSADVDAVVGVGGMPEDAVVLLVEAVHRAPRQRDLVAEHGRVCGQRDVLPGAARGLAGAADHLEPCGVAEVAMLAAVIARPERALGEVGEREVRDRVATGLEEQDGIVALHHGAAAEHGAQPAPQRLGVEQALRHPRSQEPPAGVAAQRPLLP